MPRAVHTRRTPPPVDQTSAPPNRLAAPRSLASQLPEDWRQALEAEVTAPYFAELETFVAEERMRGNVFPAPEDVFAALRATPLDSVRVVLMGQDPYPTAGNANGLSFSVAAGRPIPASLRNMLEGARQDVGTSPADNGDLEPWAKQGVLLLNAVLTVREGEANSHKGKGWERFTGAILAQVKAKQERVVFLNLGKAATKIAGTVPPPHLVIDAPHPSPLNIGNPFAKAKVFSAVNRALVEAGRAPIDWQLP